MPMPSYDGRSGSVRCTYTTAAVYIVCRAVRFIRVNGAGETNVVSIYYIIVVVIIYTTTTGGGPPRRFEINLFVCHANAYICMTESSDVLLLGPIGVVARARDNWIFREHADKTVLPPPPVRSNFHCVAGFSNIVRAPASYTIIIHYIIARYYFRIPRV